MRRLLPLLLGALLLVALAPRAAASPGTWCAGTVDVLCTTCPPPLPGARCTGIATCLVYVDGMLARTCVRDFVGVEQGRRFAAALLA